MKYLVTLKLLETYEVLVEAPDSDTASSVANEIDISEWKNTDSDTQHFEVKEFVEEV